MMMSSPFLFGHQTGANYDWDNIASLQDNAKMDTQFQSGDNTRGSSEVVAKIGSNTYETLQEAINAATEGQTVIVLENIELESTVTVASDKVVTLDLNGKTISGVCNSGQGHMFMVQNTADLTVKDSSENKEGKITYARGTSNTGWVIDLEGDLILESGTIELTGDSWSIGYAVDVRPNSWGTEYTEGTTFTMNGGKLVSSDAAVRVASSSADNHENVSANFIMNGGEIEAAWDGIFVQQSNTAYDILNVRIDGGNIKSALSPLRLYGPAATSVLNNDENPITLDLNGGIFDYTGSNLEDTRWLVPGVIMIAGGATFDEMLDYTGFEITGGTFDGDVSAFCAEGYELVETGDGTYGVVEEDSVAQIVGGQGYATLAGAFGAVENGETIIMLANVEVDESLNNTKNITLDLNGKTISKTFAESKADDLIVNKGSLVITDNTETKTGKVTYKYTGQPDSNYTYDNATIQNEGTLTILAGIVENTTQKMSHASYAINTNAGATLNIEGGKVLNLNGHAIRMVSFGTAQNTVNVSGGYIEGTRALQVQLPGSAGSPSKPAMDINISGGELKSNENTYNLAIYVYSNGQSAENLIDLEISGDAIINGNVALNAAATNTMQANTAIVSGGTINGQYGIFSYAESNDHTQSVIEITGGTFATNYSAWYAYDDGFIFDENTDGTYSVVEDPNVAQIGETKYTSLQEAIDAAEEGQTVKVIRDINLTQTVTVAAGKDVILDLNGKDINVANDQVNFNINGKLTLNDETGEGVFTSRNHFVNEGAEFIVNAGTVQNVATATGGFPINLNGGSVTINGGTVQAVNNANYAIGGNGGTLVINDGTVKGNWGAVNLQSGNATIKDGTLEVTGTTGGHALYVAGDTQVTIEGGEFKPYNGGGAASYALVLNGGNPTVNVSGGMFHKGWGCVIVYAGNLSLTGGTFGSNMVITNNNPLESADINTYCAEGYAALPDLNGNFIVGTKPTATVNNLGRMTIPAGEYSIWDGSFDQNTEDDGDMPLSFVMQFLADQDADDMATSPFADWYGDFVITFTGIENESFIADGCYLAGHYGDFGWVKIPVDGMEIEGDARYPVMLGVGLGQKYDYICSSVEDFKCALYLTPEILAANPNIRVNLELAIVDNSQGPDAATSALVENENVYKVVEYNYDAIDFNTNYVARIGDTGYEKLQDAFDAAESGDTIKLLANNNENILVGNENLKPYNKTIIVEGNGREATGSWNFGRDDNQPDQSEITVTKVNFKGYGISIDEFKSVTISECTFTDITSGNAITVICDNHTETVSLVENTITNVAAGTGIRIRNAKAANVESNIVDGTFNNAILLEGNTYGDVEVVNNVIKDWGKDTAEKGRAIHIVKGANTTATIENNAMIHDNAPEEFVKITGNTENVSIDKNYWNGANPVEEHTPAYYLVEGITPNSYYQNYSVENGLENLLPTQASVAQIGDYYYSTLEAAFEAVQTGETIIMIADAELETTITIPVEKTVILNLNGKKIAYTSTTQGEAMITNRGNLTINDGDSKDGMGEIYYNYTGAADPSYGKGNYTISNAGTLTVNGGKIHIANLRQHAKYPIDNNSGSGDAILVINGGHLYNYNTSAIRQFCNSTTNKNSVTINGGLIEGYSAIWMQNPGKNTVNGQLTINAGEIKTTAKAYVNGTSPISEVASKIYCTTEGGTWDEGSALIIEGGIISENVCLNNETPASVTLNKEATYNGSIRLDEGGQFVHNGLMNVTLSKDITGTPIDDNAGWYTISSPVGPVDHDKVDDLLNGTHDLYRYDEPTMMWENVKNNEHTDFTTLEAGRGYIYANTANTTLSFTGDLVVEAVEQNITATDNNLKGFNLVGNPFTHNITLDHISGANLAAGFYTLTNEGAWNANNSTTGVINALQGALIKTTETKKVQINPAVLSKSRSVNNGQLEINVSNANYNDVAYVTFNKGIGLDKIEHRNANIPMVYVPVNGTNYAVAIMSNDVTEIPVSFVAKTMGEYTISVEAQDCEFAQMYLIDKMTGYSTNLLLEDYTFMAKSGDNAERFVIRLVNSFDHSFGAENFIIFNDEEMMINDIQGEGVIRIVDVLGRPVAEYNVFGSANISTTSFRSGAYMIQVIDESGVKVQKIIID